MNDAPAQPFPNCTPIVLVGGRSVRFGRNKLLEPLPGGGGGGEGASEFIVDRPIVALRAVFGPRVALVGRCDPAVASRADTLITDPLDDRGPLSGIVTALRTARSDIFVLAGDLPLIEAAIVRAVMAASQSAPFALAVLAHSGHLEPCIGLYRFAALDALTTHLESGRRSLHNALDPAIVHSVPVPPRLCLNINHLHDLSALAPLPPT